MSSDLIQQAFEACINAAEARERMYRKQSETTYGDAKEFILGRVNEAALTVLLLRKHADLFGATRIPMILHCPECRTRHIDEGYFATEHHHTHSCQQCGLVWRPAIEATVGVRFLPGFKNEQPQLPTPGDLRPEKGAPISEPLEEIIARQLYNLLPYDGPPGTKKPAWEINGNSDKQDHARLLARVLIRTILEGSQS